MIRIIIEKTQQYLSIPSVVGHEGFFMQHLYEDFKKAGLFAYKHEGVLEVHGKDAKSAIICAHIDRHGLICLGDHDYVYAAQYMKEIKYGENNLSSRAEVEGIASRFEGERVYAYHPDTGEVLGRGVIEACYPDLRNHDALFDVAGVGRLEQNVPLAYERQARFGDGILSGQIDNVVSLAVVYALFAAGFEGTALLTCEEEIGKSWIPIAQYLEGSHTRVTDRVIVLDTSPYNDGAVIEEGPVILRNRDKSEVYNAALVGDLKTRCRDLGLPFRVKDEDLLAKGKTVAQLGSTELGRLVQGTKGQCSGATVQIPTLMYHTSNETTTQAAIENYYIMLRSILIDTPLDLRVG